jgi:tRNA wybutosine-synthesizing protein 1
MIQKNYSNFLKTLRKRKYGLVGKHSAVQVCNWTKNSLNNNGSCWKEKFYGIQSHRCCQVSVSLFNCENKCLHCWRDTSYTLSGEVNKPEEPKELIKRLVEERKRLMNGFGGNEKAKKKLKEAFEPTLFTFSLTGEATLYPRLGEMIKELRKQGKITFLVTNGLNPKFIKKLDKENNLPTQLVVSLNTSNKKLYDLWHCSSKKNAWKKLNETLALFKKLKGKTRIAVRLNLVKKDIDDGRDIGQLSNMEDKHIKEYASLIKKAMPDFIHVDGFKSIGDARKRLSWKKMPCFGEIKEFALKLEKELKNSGYKIMGEEYRSAVVMLSNRKSRELRIKKSEV